MHITTAIYLRMFGYTMTILMHVGNILFLLSCMDMKVPNDVDLKVFSELQPRYFTCWNFFLHVLFSVVGLISDSKLLLNSDNPSYIPSKHFEWFKKTLFSTIIWPSTWVVVAVFWPLYLYDRQLIFPKFADKIITPLSNHIMHTAIIGSIVWEVCFQPREVPSSHKRNILHIIFHLLLYFCILMYTYIERGVWLYPIFKILYGTIYFPVSILLIGVVAITSYYVQWLLTELMWGRRQKSIKIR
ncbi:androgen-dependent TFPI-regulating protein-like [Melitaea cinxia]|uniref:androgen-dependent TFPI-regulating protein-like n=1 Tax=Melitaea cinxia TaxID=113334 RepID=UPI001E271F3C|nr:androgen-dependent TFPI-regulating protein-like [Melitaea cinxia]